MDSAGVDGSGLGEAIFDLPVIVLAGGLGTRLSSVLKDSPKILAPIEKYKFLDLLLIWLQRQGVKKVVFSLGYLSEQVIEHLQSVDADYTFDLDYVVESSPLGTLGGLVEVLTKKDINECVVMNGDTYVDINLLDFIKQKNNDTYCELSVVRVDDVSRYGSIDLGEDKVIKQFKEKNSTTSGSGWINSGVYYFSMQAVSDVKCLVSGSLEKEFFENCISRLTYYKIDSNLFIDIGTPASYRNAATVMQGLMH
jgi:NDP-sugar pyrophosphorylase family protein